MCFDYGGRHLFPGGPKSDKAILQFGRQRLLDAVEAAAYVRESTGTGVVAGAAIKETRNQIVIEGDAATPVSCNDVLSEALLQARLAAAFSLRVGLESIDGVFVMHALRRKTASSYAAQEVRYASQATGPRCPLKMVSAWRAAQS